MKRRLALSLFAMLALLWQSVAAAAMMPAVMQTAPAHASAAMPEHCGMAGMHHAAAPADSAKAPNGAMKNCCKAGHCACIAACGAIAMSSSADLPALPPGAGLLVAAPAAGLSAAAPPHPFRPPIAS